MHRPIVLLLCLMLLTGCAAPAQAASPVNPDDMFTSRDLRTSWDAPEAVRITLTGASAACSDPSVSIAGGTVTVTREGTYVLSGRLDNGTVIIDCGKNDKVQLVLDNAFIHADTFAAIHVRQADKVFITLADGSANTLSNGGRFVQIDKHDVASVIYSRDDLTVNGSGSLTIVSPAGHGIDTKDDLVITGGTFHIDAASHGLAANDSVRIRSASMHIVAGKDGMQAENDEDAALGFVYIESGSFDVTAGDDGVSATSDVLITGGAFRIGCTGDALHADSLLTVTGGTIDVSSSNEGLEGNSVAVTGGAISVVSTDDGVNAADGDIRISGGTLYVNAEGDGLDANGSIAVSGGTVTVAGPSRPGNAPIDYDKTAVISGGTVIAYGSDSMVQHFSPDSTQGAMLLTFRPQPAGTAISVTDASGRQLLAVTAEKPFSALVVSCPGLTLGQTYTVRIGDSETAITLDPLVYPAETRRRR